MSLKNIRLDLSHIVEKDPFWISHLKYNPIKSIIQSGKTYHLIFLLEDVFGFKKSNPMISNIKQFHYKDKSIDNIFKELKESSKKIAKIDKNDNDEILQVLSILAKINHFKVYNKKYIDLLIKEIIKTNLIEKTSILKYQAMLIFFINKLGYRNIFLDKFLKNIENLQNSDGGWAFDISKVNDFRETDVFSTLIIYRVFVENNLWRNKKFLLKAESFLLENHLSEKQNNEDLDRWSRIYIGYKKNNLFEGGTILLLEALLINANKQNQNKIKSIINWLKDLQLKNGYFPYHSALSNQENTSSTIKALSLIKKYYISLD